MNKTEILDLLDEYGIARIREALESLMLLSIRIHLHPACDPSYYGYPVVMRPYSPVSPPPLTDNLPLGTSKIGGYPDLPEGYDWPVDAEGLPLPFFTQINFAEIGAADEQNQLPHTGILIFFMNIAFDTWHTFYFQGESAELVRTHPPATSGPEAGHFIPPYSMTFESEWTIPDMYNTEEAAVFDLSEEEAQPYQDFRFRIRGWGPEVVARMESGIPMEDFGHHHLLGWDDLCWTDGRGASAGETDPDLPSLFSLDTSNLSQEEVNKIFAPLSEAGKEWQALLEIDTSSFSNQRWDYGWKPCFYIRKEDLKARHLDKVWLISDKA